MRHPPGFTPRSSTIAAIVVYLYVGQFLSRNRTAQALAELFGTPLSGGTVAALTARAAGRLDGFLGHVRDKLTESAVVGFDETGLRVAGRLHWVHCARTDRYTLVTCHPRRGRKGIDDLGVLPGFAGVAIHDAWAPYDTYLDCEHQLCCAHALRELQAVCDSVAEGEWCWATQAADALVAMQTLVSDTIDARRDSVDEAALTEHIHHYRSAALIGIDQSAARSDKLMNKRNALGPQAHQPPGRLPTLHPRLASRPGQQRQRTRHPHDQK